MNIETALAGDTFDLAQKRVLAFTLKSGLLWNNQPYLEQFIGEDGLFYSSLYSAGEHFITFLHSIGVLVRDGGRSRLALRPDAIIGYAIHLIETGLDFSKVIDALVCLSGESWLPTSREPFKPTYYPDQPNPQYFDTRLLFADLAFLGYVERVDERFRWTALIEPAMKAHHFWYATADQQPR